MYRIYALFKEAACLEQSLTGFCKGDLRVATERRRSLKLVQFEIHPPIAGT